ncbi:Cytochrome P450 CYP2 subfamily [Handroanthus impetiginosus]|uniref:Cytochrome P450 CYP2 subfamily n=1 Tax=Handroanthus impetiginosus TaxID=429701 RepID=A0A2G9GHG6_9LAMI|nr:Cytochrome P450 CYP2 subfamily [Handroanthus impetiginosus]
MDTLLYFLLYLIITLVLLFLCTITQHFLDKLANLPPTPFPSLPFIGHIYFFAKTIPFHRAMSDVSRRHGPVVFLRLGSRPVLLVSSPSATQECLTQNDIIFANRPPLLNGKHFGYNFTSLAWSSYGDHWRNLRRISAIGLLSSHKLQMLSSIRVNESRAMITRMIKDNKNDPIDMRATFFGYTYNVVMGMITGELQGVEDSSEMFQEIVEEMSRVTLEANIVDFLPFVGYWFGFKADIERKFSSIQEKRDKFMENVIEKHRGILEEIGDNGHDQKSLIKVLLDLERGQPEYYTDETIRNLLLVLVQGASHSTSNTLEWAFSLLLENPDTMTRARAEIDNLVGKEQTLRMHPAAPLLTPHYSSEKCIVGGFSVPPGTMLLVNVWDFQNNPQTWKDPEKFMPDRFTGKNSYKDYNFKFVPFGRGRRACPGENLAMNMVGLALGTLIQCFEWEKYGEIDMGEGRGVITPRIQPLRAKCIPRPFLVDLL